MPVDGRFLSQLIGHRNLDIIATIDTQCWTQIAAIIAQRVANTSGVEFGFARLHVESDRVSERACIQQRWNPERLRLDCCV